MTRNNISTTTVGKSHGEPQALHFDEGRQTHEADHSGFGEIPSSQSQGSADRTLRVADDQANDDFDADDLTPETLVPDDGLPIPSEAGRTTATDTLLQETDADGIGAGAGSGLDEAELADVDPVGREASRTLENRAIHHASDARFFEPAEAEMQRQKLEDELRFASADESNAPEAPDARSPATAERHSTNITIHLSVHRHRALSLQTDHAEAEAAYDRHIPGYLDYLREEATAAGFGLVSSPQDGDEAFVYHGTESERKAAHEWLHTLPDLWNWIP